MTTTICIALIFLSTLSLRRATQKNPSKLAKTSYFYPRSPCGERRPMDVPQYQILDISIHALLAESDLQRLLCVANSCISIHALLAESDNILCVVSVQVGGFLSTLSLRRATNGHETSPYRVWISIHALLAESDRCQASDISVKRISIHALLAESDRGKVTSGYDRNDFYPRSPCGERPTDMRHRLIEFGFLSTLSLRRATARPNCQSK